MRFVFSFFALSFLATPFSCAQAPGVLLFGEPRIEQLLPPCVHNPHEKEAEAELAQIQVAIAFYLGKYGEYPASLNYLGPPDDNTKPSAKAAGLLKIQSLTAEQEKYKFRYERTDDGFGVWATPKDFALGCGSVYMDQTGGFRRHWEMSEASSGDAVAERQADLNGDVTLRLLVDTKGRPIEAVPLHGPEELYLIAVQKALAMKFEKTRARSPIRVNLDINFKIEGKDTQPASLSNP